MRESYFQVPADSLTSAQSVLLDWNISARIEHLHRRQASAEPLNTSTPEMIRLRNLADSIPERAVLITGLGAAEPEVRRLPRGEDLDRHTSRADAASFYLSEGRSYLRSLLDGGASGGVSIKPAPDAPPPVSLDPLRRIIAVPYAALLKAVQIDLLSVGSAEQKVDEFRFFLEHVLKASPSREGWVGFLLLGGTPENRQRARRLLKLDSKGDVLEKVWGAAWDLMYTRMPIMVQLPVFHGRVQLPLTFVTDDSALLDAIDGLTGSVQFRNDRGIDLAGDEVDIDAVLPSVAATLRSYMARDGKRVALRSRGLTNSVMSRGVYEARRIERALHSHQIVL
jgi:hypothetical protein